MKDRKMVEIISAINSNYVGMKALIDKNYKVYLGKKENYHYSKKEPIAYYDNQDNSLCFISNNPKIFSFLYGSGWILSQKEMLQRGYFTMDIYKEYDSLRKGILKKFKTHTEIYFKDKQFYSPEKLKEEEIEEEL